MVSIHVYIFHENKSSSGDGFVPN